LPLGESLRICLLHAWAGVRDASNWHDSIAAIYSSKTLQVQTAKCFLLNGLIFLGSLYMFDLILRPSLAFFTTWFVCDAVQICWVYPIYCLSFFLNSLWYQKVADHAYRLREGRSASAQISYDRLVNRLTDEVYRALLFFNYVVFATMAYAIPLVGPLLSFAYACWIAAFYSFEYDWINRGWTMDQRMDYFETHWAYFAGFGLPSTAVTFFFPQFVSTGIFALLFPVFVIMSNMARPVPRRRDNPQTLSAHIPRRLPVFSPAKRMNLIWIRRLS
ncbi:etoposide-induced protein 2.4-domain-containing protein, partial [Thamnocephalis sphaerospora]